MLFISNRVETRFHITSENILIAFLKLHSDFLYISVVGSFLSTLADLKEWFRFFSETS